ncbi:hypothetical protein FV139_03435 [Parahaliea maris]|uniref:Uncharacterized protein n=1 Tax=Parahaliea maris TaxID=2716870 RepID=A0A5C9A916_9GAMM|nr:hypothetical protein [Parahaliea maris]TXS96544.1 hypothetical protein FV139_03435 [Parahaliea maris]
MKLSALKAFLPSKHLLAVALILGLAALWYLQLADRQADHIVRRNFNHLNQITANIETVHAGLESNVLFECEKVLEEIGPDYFADNASATANKVKAFYTRWAGNSVLVRGASSISVEKRNGKPQDDTSLPWGEAASTKTQKKSSSDAASSTTREQRCKRREPALTLHMKSGSIELVPGGILSRFILSFKGMDSGNSDATAEKVFQISIKQDFSLVNGLDFSEGYFDTILLGTYEDKGGQVFYNTATTTASVPEDNIRDLFNATHDYARFSSLRAFARATRISELKLADLAANGSVKGAGMDSDESWSSQSRLLSIPLGRDDKIAFSQPLTLSFLESQAPVIVGLMEASEFNRLKYHLPLNVVLLLVVVLLAGILSLSFLRLVLLPKHAVIRRYDVILSFVSLVGLALLTNVFLANLTASYQFDDIYRKDLKAIHRDIQKQFYQEREKLVEYLLAIVDTRPEDSGNDIAQMKYELLAPHGNTTEDPIKEGHNTPYARACFTSGVTIADSDVDNDSVDKKTKSATWTRQCYTDTLPLFTDLFLLDGDAQHLGSFVTFDSYNLKPGFKVSSRKYYTALKQDSAWKIDVSGVSQPYYMERIETLSDGALETGISIRIPSVAQFCHVDDAHDFCTFCEALAPEILVGTTQIRSFDYTTMPPGFGFAVFDRYTGNVLYHSNNRRSRRENFYRATDDSAELKAAAISGLDANLDLSYKGEEIRVKLSSLRATDWMLATFYDKSLVDVVNFRFSAASFGLSGLVLIGIPLAIATLGCILAVVRAAYQLRIRERNVSRRYPEWTYPNPHRPDIHRILSLYFGFLLWLYIGVIYYLDLGAGYLWWLFVLVASPLLWYLFTVRARATSPPNTGTVYQATTPGNRWRRLMGVANELRQDLVAIAQDHKPLAGWFLTSTVICFLVLAWLTPGASLFNVPLALVAAFLVGLVGLALLLPLYATTSETLPALTSSAAKPAPEPPEPELTADQAATPPAFSYAALSWYRMQLCLLLLLVAVLPAIQLQNESYDVHERLWLDFHSWAVSDRLMVRSQAIRDYAGGLRQAHNFDLEQQLFNTDSSGIYLPRTLLVRQHEGAEQTLMDSREKDRYGELVQAEDKIIRSAVSTESLQVMANCHPHSDSNRGPHEIAQLRNRIDNFWVGNAAKSSPAFSNVGAILSQFIDVDQHAHRYQPDLTGEDDDNNQEGCASGQASLYFVDHLDERRGTHFLFDYYFPHTRADPLLIVSYYLVLILVAAALIQLLLGFIMRRTLLCRELELEPPLLNEPTTGRGTSPRAGHPFAGRDSLWLMVPAHIDIVSAFESARGQLLPESAGVEANPGSLRGGKLLKYETAKTLVLIDFFEIIRDRGTSASVAKRIKSEFGDDWRLVVFSYMHPAYWLKHRMGADDLPEAERSQWEQWLRQPSVYRYFEGEMARPVSTNYRRAWEHSSMDERLVLGSIYYEGLIHYRNRNTLQSLVNRGLLQQQNHHLTFSNVFLDEEGRYNWGQFLHDNLPLGEFKRQASGYQTSLWKAFRGPILLALLALLGFLTYVAQDELRTVLSLLAALGAATAALASVGERLRAFQNFMTGNSRQ